MAITSLIVVLIVPWESLIPMRVIERRMDQATGTGFGMTERLGFSKLPSIDRGIAQQDLPPSGFTLLTCPYIP
jgi:hypothetical protein